MDNLSLTFSASELLCRGKGFTYDDVCLVPKRSSISSRSHPLLTSRLTRNHTIDLPLISSNMDTISEKEMCQSMAKLGAVGSLHRFMSMEEQVAQVHAIATFQQQERIKTPIAASIGVKEEGARRAEKLIEAGAQILTIDIAHGDSDLMLETLRWIKKEFPHVDVIAGNVATPTAVKGLIDAGADAIKVGIGPGSMCTTRLIAGCGVPQLTAVSWCAQETKKANIPLIADGGLRTSGDIMKALAAGADTVMLGSMLAGTLETPGELQAGFKVYRGMASKDAQVSWRGDLPEGMAPEGVSSKVACKGSVHHVIKEIAGGIRSGMTYLNLNSLLEDNREDIHFIEMSYSGRLESGPHGLTGKS